MRTAFLVSLITAFFGFDVASRAAEPEPPLRVSIVPSHSFKDRKLLSTTGAKGNICAFDVVLTNVSSAPVTVWEPNCSWGFYCLSFEFIRDGQRRLIKRQPTAWDSNQPRPFTIDPQEHYVLSVNFGDHTWPTDWMPAHTAEGTVVVLRATYAIPPLDEMARRRAPEVWVGSASSALKEFTIR